jgi:hypothetical protein
MEKTSVGTAVGRTGVGVTTGGNGVDVEAGNAMVTVGAAPAGEGEHETPTLVISIESVKYISHFTVNLLYH